MKQAIKKEKKKYSKKEMSPWNFLIGDLYDQIVLLESGNKCKMN